MKTKKDRVVPSVFSTDKREFVERLELLQKISENLHIDVMDGIFVTKKSIPFEYLEKYKIKENWEVHLMVENPEKYFAFLQDFKKIIFHFEAYKTDAERIGFIDMMRKEKKKIFLALNPNTEIEEIVQLLHMVDGVMFMGVEPGGEGKKFIFGVYNKIKELRKFNKKILIQVDGGVNNKIAIKLKNLGVNIINTGSFVYRSENPLKALEEFKKIFI